jgi:coiled-coil domain-containing protein 55
MSGLKFNFNKPKESTKKAAPPLSRRLFDDDASEEDGKFSQSKKPSTSSKERQPDAITGVNQDLRSYILLSEETSARMAKEALEVDPSGIDLMPSILLTSVFAYDDVYDDLKAVEREKKAIAEQQRIERKVWSPQKIIFANLQPQYMGKLLASAELRKRDFLIAEERKYQKEREAEGDDFEGKEKFVTNAYKRQQEELRKADEDEKQREGILFP